MSNDALFSPYISYGTVMFRKVNGRNAGFYYPKKGKKLLYDASIYVNATGELFASGYYDVVFKRGQYISGPRVMEIPEAGVHEIQGAFTAVTKDGEFYRRETANANLEVFSFEHLVWRRCDYTVWYEKAHRYYLPDHVWSSDHLAFFHKDKPIPEKVLTLQEQGFVLSDFPYCCGAKILYNFGTMKNKESYIKTFNKFLPKNTGIILAILNPRQKPEWEHVLLDAGFVLLSEHTNFIHSHPNYLYGWKCQDHQQEVKEKARSF